jgi:lipase maturation factor 1
MTRDPEPIDRGTRALCVPGPLTTWVFQRLLGLVYVIAFGSFLVQAAGLVGDRGVLPARDFLGAVHDAYGARAYRLLPTVNWVWSSTLALQVTSAAGIAAGICVLIGRWGTRSALFVAWVLYLSLVGVGQVFYSFQWDILLLEAGFLAVLLHSWPAGIAWLYRWLAFRLLFLSGAVKLLSGDESWRSLTALTYHFETQPLPNLAAWFVHQLPRSVLEAMTAGTFVAELVLPCLFFAPRRIRLVAAAASIAFQALIFLTGNYAFFNILTVAVILWLLDDAALAPVLTTRRRQAILAAARYEPGALSRRLAAAVATVVALVSVATVLETVGVPPPPPLPALQSALEPLHVANGYGLFAVMTTTRPEIVFEASNDGTTWREYVFRYKPGPLDRRPRQVAPYQPRLDWQLWFAALGGLNSNRWVLALTRRLLEGSGAVEGLIGPSPLPGGPPKYVRALLYDYTFTDLGALRSTGRWWKRRLLGTYVPPITRDDLMPPVKEESRFDDGLTRRTPATMLASRKVLLPFVGSLRDVRPW